jgi:hypothetical protein
MSMVEELIFSLAAAACSNAVNTSPAYTFKYNAEELPVEFA